MRSVLAPSYRFSSIWRAGALPVAQEDGINVRDWLQNLATFTGQAFKRLCSQGLNLPAFLQVHSEHAIAASCPACFPWHGNTNRMVKQHQSAWRCHQKAVLWRLFAHQAHAILGLHRS